MNRMEIGSQLQTLVDRLVERDRLIQNAVLGVSLGSEGSTWTVAAGFAQPATRTPMQAESPFFIASVTKMFTAAAIMLLKERGRLALDDKLSQHLPGDSIQGLHCYKGTDYTDTLTIRHLISQTSGLPDYFLDKPRRGKSLLDRILAEGDAAWTSKDMLQMVRTELTPRLAPGTGAHYADTNYQLLGAILEAVMAKPIPAIFCELIFRPLQLTQTYVYGSAPMQDVIEPAHLFYKDRHLNLDQTMRSWPAEGGMVSTVGDCLRFLKALMQGQLFAQRETVLEMQRQWHKIFFPLQYGYGLMRFKLPRLLSPFQPAPELIGHSGYSGSFLYYCPELDLYIAGTLNQSTRQSAAFRLMLNVTEIIRRASQ